jgi:hypothetical protein
MFPAREPEPLIGLGLNQPAPSQPEIPTADSLQFHTLIPDDPSVRRCTLCSQAIPGEYFQVNGATACPHCAQARLAGQQQRGGWPEFGRAALFGLGGAIAGSLLFAIVALTMHMRLGLLGVVVGVMVGRAVLMGSRGLRGRRYQVLAVLLTYCATATSYAPMILTGMVQAQTKLEDQRKAAGQPPLAPKNQKVTPIQLALFAALLIALSLASPFFLLTQGSGIIDLVILAIGLMQAWRLTKLSEVPVMGPYAA